MCEERREEKVMNGGAESVLSIAKALVDCVDDMGHQTI